MTNKKPTKIDNAFVISHYYGFEGLEMNQIDKESHEKAKKLKSYPDFEHSHLPKIEEAISIIQHSNSETEKKKPFPLMYYSKGELKNPHQKNQKRKSGESVSLHIIGTPKSIAEAILIKTAYSILKEEGYKNLSVEINNIGNKETLAQYSKTSTSFFRNKLNELNTDCKELLKFGGHTLVSCDIKGVQHLLKEAPAPIEFLNEENRVHLKEVVEYLESQHIPFEINKFILGDPHYSSNTIFTILDEKTGKILATGSRYNELSKKTLNRKGVPAVSVSIKLPKLKQVPYSKIPKFDTCDIYFIQLGYGAKLKSLEVVELLRKAGIPVHQSIGRDKMATQTQFAHKKGVKYMLLMGQKEALENSISVRNLETNSQRTIPLSNLVEYLQNLKKTEKTTKTGKSIAKDTKNK
jgi:histidyl-tRNA synthetase